MERIHGVIPPMVTPFKADGDFDSPEFVSNVEKWNEAWREQLRAIIDKALGEKTSTGE